MELNVHHSYQLKIFFMSFAILEALCFWSNSEYDLVSIPKIYERVLMLLLVEKDSSSSNFINEVFKSTLLPISLIEDRMIPIQNTIKTQTSNTLTTLETRRIFIIIRFLLSLNSKYSSLISFKLFLFFIGFLFECRRLPISFMNIEDFCTGKHLVFLAKKDTDKKSPSIHGNSIFSSWGFSTISSYLTLSGGPPPATFSTHNQDLLLIDGITPNQTSNWDSSVVKKKLPDLYPGSSMAFIEECFLSNSDFETFFKFTTELSNDKFISYFKDLLHFIDLFSLGEKHYDLDSNSINKTDVRLYTSMRELFAFYCESLYLVLHLNLQRIDLIWYFGN